MLQIFAYDFGSHYQIIVTDGTEKNTFEYDFGVDQPIQISANEALLLTQAEIKKNSAPTRIDL
ncbi:hypothetical protein P9314_03935 [Paenibacillus validus]|uniref:hypothetical protein n=1 Tax=Paenibacillus validus TaxID=44253 RepID=UPI000FD9FDB0|nr:hypothetical protein [Paenibacillus validus]MED4599857.1 hypothetical protein [Paenibacillus validus]MED4606110.1 hypothetical protein [Paenibacillus validus]